jgi:hypothetical protein
MKLTREPAVWVGLIGTILTSLAALNTGFLNGGQAAAATAFVSAVVIAIFTRPVAPALFVAAFAALAALFAEYGLHWSDALIGGVTSLILAGFTLFGIRPQVSPTSASGNVVAGTTTLSTATVVR